MKRTIRKTLVTALALLATVAAAEDNAFRDISRHYEAIRQALMNDSTDGVAEHAAAIQSATQKLNAEFTPEAAGIQADDSTAARELLPEIIDRSGRLAAAQDLTSVRTELAELTKPLTRYHALVQGDRPVVVYCPMEKKAWLQPDGPIGNPYAPSMLRCGEVVAR
jgi:hypothetical protein